MKKAILLVAAAVCISNGVIAQDGKKFKLEFDERGIQMLDYIISKSAAEYSGVTLFLQDVNAQISKQIQPDTAKAVAPEPKKK